MTEAIYLSYMILAITQLLRKIGVFLSGLTIATIPVVPSLTPSLMPTLSPSPTPRVILRTDMLTEVAFSSQAPFGEWNDKRYQDACEETSVLMAYCAVTKECPEVGGVLDKNFVKNKIADMAEYQLNNYGSFVDTSASDTQVRLVKGYLNYANSEVIKIKNVEDILGQLQKGNILVVPTNGKLLNNPNFTNGGPERHNLVIIGYDAKRKEFITNDPGTRNGRGYKYDEYVLFNAIGDYPTGDHEAIKNREKVMIEF